MTDIPPKQLLETIGWSIPVFCAKLGGISPRAGRRMVNGQNEMDLGVYNWLWRLAEAHENAGLPCGWEMPG